MRSQKHYLWSLHFSPSYCIQPPAISLTVSPGSHTCPLLLRLRHLRTAWGRHPATWVSLLSCWDPEVTVFWFIIFGGIVPFSLLISFISLLWSLGLSASSATSDVWRWSGHSVHLFKNSNFIPTLWCVVCLVLGTQLCKKTEMLIDFLNILVRWYSS